MISKLLVTKRIYDIINGVVSDRMQNGVVQDDTLQILLDSADDKMVMVGVSCFIRDLTVNLTIHRVVHHGSACGWVSFNRNYRHVYIPQYSSHTVDHPVYLAAWLITFLAGHPTWREKAKAEAEALLLNHSSSTPGSSNGSALASIPLSAWESEMPVFDAIIRETLRLAQPHTAMRRNMGPDTYIAGAKVPSGSYVVYPFSDVHLNGELYPDPWKFDPGRPEQKVPYSWIGWGGGKCSREW